MGLIIQKKHDTNLSLVDGLICFYLALPLLIFCSWFKLPFAIAFAAMVLFSFYKTLHAATFCNFEITPKLAVVILLVAGAWTALAGIGHFVFANFDWVVRDAVLRDLIETAWPPKYGGDGAFALILRAPVAYYLPAAVVGTLLGLGLGDIALYLWTVAGFVLFLWAATTLFPSNRHRMIAICVLIWFGGLDLLGFIQVNGVLPALGMNIEGWAKFAQYSSNSTLLFWVPNHALPSWLGIVLVLRHWRKSGLAQVAPLLAATIPLWSPLAAIGLAPFVITGLSWRQDYRRLFSIQTSLPWLGLAMIVARYITLDAQTIPSGWALSTLGVSEFFKTYTRFVILEFGLLVLILRRMGVYDLQLWVAVLVLLALPLYRFGVANDLVMRSSIPALAVVALATVRPLMSVRDHFWRQSLLVLMILGALGSAEQPLRAILRPRWALTGQTLQEVMSQHFGGALPPHYVAKLNQPGLMKLMREPSLVQPTTLTSPVLAP